MADSANDDKPTIILLVEDEALLNVLASDILSEAGYRVLETFSADEALQVLEVRPDVKVLLTDVDMPGSINGYGLARIVDMRWPGIGILVVSGKALPGPGDLPGKAHFLAKPYNPSALLDAIKIALAPVVDVFVVDTIEVHVPEPEKEEPVSAPVLPVAITPDPLQTDLGHTGGLADPLIEPDE